jgi:acetylornithine aminotransferase
MTGLLQYQLFIVNSGAEANENALKMASFHTQFSKVISFKHGFHGRTSAAVNVTDNPRIKAPINLGFENTLLELGDEAGVIEALEPGDTAAVIVEGIQGIAGIYEPSVSFLKFLREVTTKTNTVLILDEIQSGYGRSGHFLAHEIAEIKPDIITLAKGMANGFPMGGVLFSPSFEPSYGLLGTTFGGNHLACAAAIAVLEIIEEEGLLENAAIQGEYLREHLGQISGLREIRGRGLMLGLEMDYPVKPLRSNLLFDHGLFVGSAAQSNTIRLLPSLTVTREETDLAIEKLIKATQTI